MSDEKIKALSQYLECDADEISESSYDDCVFDAEGGEYLVLTDREADDRWDESLESYIDECIIDQLPEAYQSYFDREAWKSDARYDGRGLSLSSYDGEEIEEVVDGEYYFIYRTN